MLDIKFIEQNRDIVEKAIRDKKGEAVNLTVLVALYEKRKELKQRADELNTKRNKAAEVRDFEAGRKLKRELQKIEGEFRKTTKEFIMLMAKIPNIPSVDTPVGKDEKDNKVIRQIGEKPKFSFTPKAHWDLGRELDLIDNERAAKVSGARFTYLKGDVVLMQFALVQLVLSVLTDKDKLETIKQKAGLDITVKPFIPLIPPVIVKPEILNAMARLEPRDERYYLEKDNLYLIGSAEHSMGPLHAEEVIPENELPIRYIGYSTSFRREAGSYGKDTKGILRMHQFDKLEMETFCLSGDSFKEQDFLVAIQEHFVQALNLPYQLILICTGDMGVPDQRQFDIEMWMPGQNMYRETHSADLVGAYQARRLNIRVKRKEGELEFVHMNDATAFAIGRTLIAILENNQQEDGSIVIPKILRAYMGKDVITKA